MNGDSTPPRRGEWPASGSAPRASERAAAAVSECGVLHDFCISTSKGTCDRDAHHDGSHHCSACNMLF